MQTPDPMVINGPIVPAHGGLVYQVTLASGVVVTDPSGFGGIPTALPPVEVIPLVVPAVAQSPHAGESAPAPAIPPEFRRFEELTGKLLKVPKEDLDKERKRERR